MGEDASDQRKVRRERNEEFFREANEVIEADGMKQRFLCECSSEGCMERLPLSPVEYEHARTQGDWFVVVPAHEDPSVEVVAERTDDASARPHRPNSARSHRRPAASGPGTGRARLRLTRFEAPDKTDANLGA
jgi:hypothetical protein